MDRLSHLQAELDDAETYGPQRASSIELYAISEDEVPVSVQDLRALLTLSSAVETALTSAAPYRSAPGSNREAWLLPASAIEALRQAARFLREPSVEEPSFNYPI